MENSSHTTISDLDKANATVDEWLNEWLSDDAVDVDPEDYVVVERAWFAFARQYISLKLPGWKELYDSLPDDEKP